MTSRASVPSFGAVVLVVLASHLTLFPKIADLDGFYHLGHAAAYAAGSIFDTSFPWATQSVIRDRGADIWWGFHIVLMPFASIGNVEWRIRVAALSLTSALAFCFFWVLRRHEVPGAGWWTAAFLAAVPNVLFRHLAVRPHVLSLGACLLLLSTLARGTWRQAFVASALVTWLHLSFFWIGPGIVAAYALVCGLQRVSAAASQRSSVPPLLAIAAVLLGTAAGWLLRPHPLDAGALAGVQIVRLFAQKATEEPLLFAAELAPLPVVDLVRSSWLFLAVWVVAVGTTAAAAARGRLTVVHPEERTLLFTSLLVSATFLLLALSLARRAIVEWAAFGSLALPFAWGSVAPFFRNRGARVLGVALLAAHLGWGAWRHVLNVKLVAFPSDTMAGVASFLEEHSDPGDIVFHARWDNFGPLFARDRANLYLGGMDPIFQFAHDPGLYWEYFYLSADVNVDWTCDAFPCASGRATDTHEVIREHFGARWVVVEPYRNPRLSLYLLDDPRYALAHETQRAAVFEVLPSPRSRPR